MYVKFAPTAVQTYSGNIPVSGGGAPTVFVSATGTGVDSSKVTTGIAGSISTNQATLSASVAIGCDSLTSYGFEYSTSANFVLGTGTRVNATSMQRFVTNKSKRS